MKRERERSRRRLRRPLVGALLGALGLFFVSVVWVRCGPLPPDLLDPDAHASTRVVDRRGELLYESRSTLGTRSRMLDPELWPETLVQATIAAEDRRFRWHPGVDPLAVARATWHNLRARRLMEGGSTLTQQTAKLLMQRDRSLGGKIEEAVLALRLEHRLEKNEILALYLSLAPYGNQLVGAEAASQAYFGRSTTSLTPAQAALLAALPQRPTLLDPYRHFDAAKRRQLRVLAQMHHAGDLGEVDLERARAERLNLVRTPPAFTAPHFVERVLAQSGAGARRIESTLDATLQREVVGILRAHRERLERHGAHNVAVAVLDNHSSEWLAWEGSGDWSDAEDGGTIDGVVAPRQPGSALKPFTYALAFDSGYTPASILPDVPGHYPTAVPGVLYSPRNYDGVFRGPMRARLALAGSENVPAVHLLSEVGIAELLRLLRRAGLSTLDRTPDHYGFGLTLGDAEVRLDELVAAYAAFARGGSYRQPTLVRRIERSDGALAAATPPTSEAAQPVVSPRAAFWVTSILSDPEARAFAFGSGGSLDFPFPVAVKTGTSQAYRDNWTLGYTRDVTVGVWVGNFDRAALRQSSGVTGAAPIFHDVLLAAQRRARGRLPTDADPPLASPPPGLERVSVCALSGQRPQTWCPRIEREWLPVHSSLQDCRWHHHDGGRTRVAWPAAYQAWAQRRGLMDRGTEPFASGAVAAFYDGPSTSAGPAERAGTRATAARGLAITSPPDGATYLRDPTLRAEFQTLALRAQTDAAGHLTWSVDGVTVGETTADRALDWPLQLGRHAVKVTDASGASIEARIEIR